MNFSIDRCRLNCKRNSWRVGGGRVISNVSGTGLGVVLPNDETVGVLVDLTTGVALVFGAEARLGVKEGIVAIALVGVDGETASFLDGEPDPAKKMRIPAKTASATALNATPPAEGRSLNTKRVIRPMMLVIAKWTRKTSKPCSQISGKPEPMPKTVALIGRKNEYAISTLGRKGLSSERANEMTRMIAPRTKTINSGTQSRECR